MNKWLEIQPGKWQGIVPIQPSKSLSHRGLICAALAKGISRLSHVGNSLDIDATRQGLEALGLAEFRSDGTVLGGLHRVTEAVVDCKESGSTLRFLLPIALAAGIPTRFVGQGRLLQRPMGPFIKALTAGGGNIRCTDHAIEVSGHLRPGCYHLPGNVSSQYITGLLLALPLLNGPSTIVVEGPLESAAYISLTLEVQRQFGLQIHRQDSRFLIDSSPYLPGRYQVEGDWSHAAFYLAAGFLGSSIGCGGLNAQSLQGDREICHILESLGGCCQWQGDCLTVTAKQPVAGVIDVSQVPDLAPVLAVVCCGIKGVSRLVNAGRLRLKESDRLAAIADGIRCLGGQAVVEEDALAINGTGSLRGGPCSAWNDHRIAMSLAVASTICEQPVGLEGASSVAKSAPGFWQEVKTLGGRYHERLLGE